MNFPWMFCLLSQEQQQAQLGMKWDSYSCGYCSYYILQIIIDGFLYISQKDGCWIEEEEEERSSGNTHASLMHQSVCLSIYNMATQQISRWSCECRHYAPHHRMNVEKRERKPIDLVAHIIKRSDGSHRTIGNLDMLPCGRCLCRLAWPECSHTFLLFFFFFFFFFFFCFCYFWLSWGKKYS